MNEIYLSCAYYIIGSIASIVGMAGVIVTSLYIYKYLKYKRIDALVGFYSRFQWYMRLLKNDIGEINKGNNILYYFCENADLRNLLSPKIVRLYEQHRSEIVNLLLQSENQINLGNSSEDAIKLQVLKQTLFDQLIKYPIVDKEIFLFTRDDQKTAADEEASEIIETINNIDQIIETVKKEYKIT